MSNIKNFLIELRGKLTGPCIAKFIEADNSRAPLNCSASMLKCILTYEQVPPSFLKAVYAFGDLEGESNDTGLAGFGCDSGHLHGYPRYSQYATRLAGERRLWYLVRSVERAEESETVAGWSWTIRQAAVYQSVNMSTGHSFFLIIQASGLFKRQIHQKAGWLLTDPSMGKSLTQEHRVMNALEAGLWTHLVCLSWCCRHWGECIDNLRSSLRPIFDHAATVPVDGDFEGLAVDFEFGRQRVAFGSASRQFRFRDLQTLSTFHGRVAEAMWVAAEVQNVIKNLQDRYEQMADIPNPKPDDTDIVKLCCDLRAFSETLGSAREQLKVLDSKIKMGFELVSAPVFSKGIPSTDVIVCSSRRAWITACGLKGRPKGEGCKASKMFRQGDRSRRWRGRRATDTRSKNAADVCWDQTGAEMMVDHQQIRDGGFCPGTVRNPS